MVFIKVSFCILFLETISLGLLPLLPVPLASLPIPLLLALYSLALLTTFYYASVILGVLIIFLKSACAYSRWPFD